jgi:hypothetical protein
MKAGWGFARPGRVRAIGAALEQLLQAAGLDPEREVEVMYFRGSYGWGPTHRYTYRWVVRGVAIPRELGAAGIVSTADVLFGSSSIPHLAVREDGFEVGYEW